LTFSISVACWRGEVRVAPDLFLLTQTRFRDAEAVLQRAHDVVARGSARPALQHNGHQTDPDDRRNGCDDGTNSEAVAAEEHSNAQRDDEEQRR
jgi:hypothetical protein